MCRRPESFDADLCFVRSEIFTEAHGRESASGRFLFHDDCGAVLLCSRSVACSAAVDRRAHTWRKSDHGFLGAQSRHSAIIAIWPTGGRLGPSHDGDESLTAGSSSRCAANR